jgi:hypothetical protein
MLQQGYGIRQLAVDLAGLSFRPGLISMGNGNPVKTGADGMNPQLSSMLPADALKLICETGFLGTDHIKNGVIRQYAKFDFGHGY